MRFHPNRPCATPPCLTVFMSPYNAFSPLCTALLTDKECGTLEPAPSLAMAHNSRPRTHLHHLPPRCPPRLGPCLHCRFNLAITMPCRRALRPCLWRGIQRNSTVLVPCKIPTHASTQLNSTYTMYYMATSHSRCPLRGPSPEMSEHILVRLDSLKPDTYRKPRSSAPCIALPP